MSRHRTQEWAGRLLLAIAEHLLHKRYFEAPF